MTWEEFDKIYKHTKNNEIEILQSKKCGCIFCSCVFDARVINDWSSETEEASATCPHCGMNTIIADRFGYPINDASLKEVSDFILNNPEDLFDRYPEIINRYMERYEKKEMVQNLASETLYKHFLYLKVTKKDDPIAAYKIAEMHEFGTKYTQQNYSLAINYYLYPGLKDDPHALVRLGVCDSKYNSDYLSLYTKASKAAALGSIYGICYLSDIYMKGKIDEKDTDFAFAIIEQAFLNAFIETRYKLSWNLLAPITCLAYRLGYAYEKGLGCAKNEEKAIIIYLIGNLAYKNALSMGRANLESEFYQKHIDGRLKRLSKKLGYKADHVTLDDETFFNSLEPFVSNNDMVNGIYTIPFPLLLTIRPDEYDEDSKTFTFTTTYQPGEPLVIDAEHLFCAFGEEEISWAFENVKEVIYNGEDDQSHFYKVIKKEDSIIFYARDKGEDIAILEIYLEDDIPQEKIEEIKEA